MTFVPPMLAKSTTFESLKEKMWSGWVLEPKHDGMRAVMVKENGQVRFYGRSGTRLDYTEHVPHLVMMLSDLPDGTVLDGEFAVISGSVNIRNTYVPLVDFNQTMRVMGSKPERAIRIQNNEIAKIKFIVFDMPRWAGTDYTDSVYQDRRQNMLLAKVTRPYVIINPAFTMYDYAAIYTELVAAGIEGCILKDRKSTYVPGKRSSGWLKVKSEKTFDVVVMGYTKGKGKYEGQIGAIEYGAYDDEGILKYIGRCSGMTDAKRLLFSNLDMPIGFTIEIKANDLVGSGKYGTPRHPRYVMTRIDKSPEECSIEQFRRN